MTEQRKSYAIHTDLAVEAREMLHTDDDALEGIKLTVEENENEDIKVTWVEILNKNGAQKMGKPIGNYITVESDSMKENDVTAHEEIIKILSQKLGKLHNLSRDSVVLVVGLGNWNVTPDALGPKVISKILVTRHISDSLPEELAGHVRSVGAISPGVMGLTGIETGEIIKGVAEKIEPDLIIAVDALAARRTNRINATIQMSDTGVNPGSGMGNKRMALNRETMGVPVIGIGVPTVVDAATLVNDTMEQMLDAMIQATPKGADFYKMLAELAEDEKYQLITEILTPYAGNMFVTPKEVDAVIDRLSNMIANAINIAIHPGVDRSDINRYLY